MPGNIGWLQFQMHRRSGCFLHASYHHRHGEWSQRYGTNYRVATITQINFASPRRPSTAEPQPGATVLFNGVVPPSGATVNFTSSSPAVLAPASATAPAGSTQVGVGLTHHSCFSHHRCHHHCNMERHKRQRSIDSYTAGPACLHLIEPVFNRWRNRRVRDRDNCLACDQ